MKHSPEGFLEKSFRDGSPDKIASQNMVREANSLALAGLDLKNESKSFKFDQAGKYEFLSPEQLLRNKRENISEEMRGRDKVSFVSAAFCNPLFLVGMGAAFAVLDDMRQAREARMAAVLSGSISADTVNSVRRQADCDRQEQAKIQKIESEEEKKKRLLLEATGLIGSSEKSILVGTEKSILKTAIREHQIKKELRSKMREKILSGMDKGWDERGTQKSLVNWLKTNKLMKHKMKLENMMEKSRGKESLSFVSNLAAKLEQMDKALKRLGA
ncbi:MAG: hypothetical protein JST01_27900 [Cyanobacteria bacterium SZAS TMP-1]|nr:hypothetical protein [Cyanobacteria bacterium SZAS TMP-1]